MYSEVEILDINELIFEKSFMTVKEIAELHGFSENYMREILKSFGLTESTNRFDISDKEVIGLYESGMSINGIAEYFKCSHDTISKRLKRVGLYNSRADGIKRHFNLEYQKRWNEGIKDALDQGYSMRYIEKKYHMRHNNLRDLMLEKGYYNSNDSFIDRIDAKTEELKKDRYKHRAVFYLESIKKYCLEYEQIPNRKQLSNFMDVGYPNVCLTIKRHNLSSFVSNASESDYTLIFKKKLDELGIKYIQNDRKILEGKELDFYLEDYNLGIEINPVFTHCYKNDLRVFPKKYHQYKSILAKNKGIGLIHLYDYDFKNLDKLFLWLLHKPQYKIGARQCEIKEVSLKDYKEFLDKYHFQGVENKAYYRFGLYYKNELLSLVGFGEHRFDKKYSYELIRYCTHPDYIIMGGFEKLIKYFFEYAESDCFMTYMDLNKRLKAESIYEKCGFICDSITEPNYFWCNFSGKTLSRYQTQKKKLVKLGYDKEKTEKEIMTERGFHQVFDAGSLRFICKREML